MSNSQDGFNLFSLPPVEAYDPEAGLYVALNEGDFHIKLGMLVDIIYARVGELAIPSDVVRTQQLTAAIEEALRGITIPTLPESDITKDNLDEYLNQSEVIKGFSMSLTELARRISELASPDLKDYLKVEEGTPRHHALKLNEAGQLIQANFGTSRVLYVVGRRNLPEDTVMTGSFDAPFNTIQQAIDKVATGVSNLVVQVLPSESGDYAGFVVDNRSNVTVVGVGLTDAHMVRVVGGVVNRGSSTRLRLKDLQVRQAQVDVPAYKSEGTASRDYFKNVTFEPFASNQEEPVMVLENVQNWIDFHDCNISGGVVIEGEAGVGALVAMRGNNATSTHVKLNSDVTLRLNNCTRFGSIEQYRGNLEINNCHTFTGKNGKLLYSMGGEAKLSLVDFRDSEGDFLGMERLHEVSAAHLSYCVVDQNLIKGPVKYVEQENMRKANEPEFVLSLGDITEGVREVSVVRTATNGYWFDKLVGEVRSTVQGEPLGSADVRTPVTVDLTSVSFAISHPAVEPATDFYLVLSDELNAGRTFTFGPFHG